MSVFRGDWGDEFLNGEAFGDFGSEDESIAFNFPFNFKAKFKMDFAFDADRDG